MAQLEVRNLHKSFGPIRAVEGVSFAVEAGEVVALLGPSGSGKSTLLALIAGLETQDGGEVFWEGVSLAGVLPHRHGFGVMFQDYALFPHRNVAENVGFGLRMQGKSRAEIAAGVQQALELVGMAGFEARDVNTLSGGEQQRVALARALAPRPRLLMLDEPLGALDRALRERLLEELRVLLRGRTTLYVTHDQEEAFAVADRVVILRSGSVVQSGAPVEVYARPATRFVAEFLGLTNVVVGRVEESRGTQTLKTRFGELPLSPDGSERTTEAEPGLVLEAIIRPEAATVVKDGVFHLEGRLTENSFRGSRQVVRVEIEGAKLTFEFPASQPLPALGEPLRLRLDPGAVYVFPNAPNG